MLPGRSVTNRAPRTSATWSTAMANWLRPLKNAAPISPLKAGPVPVRLVCTPETYRAFIEQVGSANMGVNYDPSHLVRMGIDPHRFLKEFVGHVFHVHGKDCMIIDENVVSVRQLAGSDLRRALQLWRHELALYHPGPRHCPTGRSSSSILEDSGYSGCVSIELEDHYYDDTEARPETGRASRREVPGRFVTFSPIPRPASPPIEREGENPLRM